MHHEDQEETRSEFYATVRSLNLGNPTSVLEFQLRLSDAIVEAESSVKKNAGWPWLLRNQGLREA